MSLLSSPLFADLSPSLLQTLENMALPRRVEEGGFFFMEGDEASHLYFLTLGRVHVFRLTTDGKQIGLRIVTPGMLFGAVAITRPEKGYPVTAQALEDSQALAWEAESFYGLLVRFPELFRKLFHTVYEHLEEAHTRLVELASQRVEQRLARLLLRLASQMGRETSEGILIDMRLTRQTLAELCDTTLFSVSRALSEWEQQGWITARREQIVLRNPHALFVLSEGLDARVGGSPRRL
ncbi:MAG: Crp/Fnr family transcriptional regulator [Anaerolineales bacterium]